MSWRRRILGSRLKTPNMEHQRQHIILPFLQPPTWWEFLLTSAGKNLVFAFHNWTRVVGFTVRKVAPDSFSVHVSQVSYLHLVKDTLRWTVRSIVVHSLCCSEAIPSFVDQKTQYRDISGRVFEKSHLIFTETRNITGKIFRERFCHGISAYIPWPKIFRGHNGIFFRWWSW